MSSDLVRLAGLYERESKVGNKYFTGLLNSRVRLVMLRNKDREGDNPPDWNLYVSAHETGRQDRQRAPKNDTGASSGATAGAVAPVTPDAPLPLQGGSGAGGGGSYRRPPTRSRRKPELPGPDGAYPELNDEVPDLA